MARRLRFIPAGHLVEVGNRTIQGRFLLRPSPELTDIILGVLGRAQRLYGMSIHAFVFLSNHYHMLVSPINTEQLAAFMNFVGTNIAKEAGKLANWKGRFWADRYSAIVVSNEEQAHVRRLQYILSNGCKEGLVARPQDWTGASTALVLLGGTTTLSGHWYDRTKEYRARQAGRTELFVAPETVTLSPLPCWAHLETEERHLLVAKMVREVEDATKKMHSGNESSPLGMKKVLQRAPHTSPSDFKPSSAPPFHAASKRVRRFLVEAYSAFAANYRQAADRLRAGELNVCFPAGSFPPPGPYALASGFG